MAKVLVVEDNAVTLESLEALLAIDGHTVVGAGNGHSALTRLALHVPDVILLDWRMPGMAGPEFMAEVGRHPEWAGIKVFVMSALAAEDLGDLPPGVALLRKPFDPQVLLNILGAIDREKGRGAVGGRPEGGAEAAG